MGDVVTPLDSIAPLHSLCHNKHHVTQETFLTSLEQMRRELVSVNTDSGLILVTSSTSRYTEGGDSSGIIPAEALMLQIKKTATLEI